MASNSYNSYNDQARNIINHNKYMVLATSDKKGEPWAAPVFYTFDKEYNFYFLSAVDSQHAKNILENPSVAVAIYDSTSPIGVSDAVQLRGKASPVTGKELSRVIELYSNRLFKNARMEPTERYKPEDYGESSEFRFFKVVVTAAFTTGIDRRVNVEFKE